MKKPDDFPFDIFDPVRNFLAILSFFCMTALLIGCSNKDLSGYPETLHFRFQSHNSQKDLYTDFTSLTECVNCYMLGSFTMTINPGDGSTHTLQNTSFFNYRYDDSNDYSLSIRVEASHRSYAFDTIIHVRDLQKVYGAPDEEERAEFMSPNGTGGFNLIHFRVFGSESEYYLSEIGENLEISTPLPIPNSFSFVHPIYVPSADGRFAVMGNSRIRLYTPDGTNVHHFDLVPRQLVAARFVNNTLMVAYDSTHFSDIYNIVKIIDLATGKMSTRIVNTNSNALFFTGDDRVAYAMRHSTTSFDIKEVDFSGTAHFTKELPDPPGGYQSIFDRKSVETSASGKLIYTGYTLISLDNNNTERWSIDLLEPDDPFFPQGVTLFKQVNGSTYVFLGGMQCWKIDALGNILWKKDYYPEFSQVRGVGLDAAGNFIMAGTRHFDYNPSYIGSSERDVILFKINQDGLLVD